MELLQVALDRVGVAHLGVVGVRAGAAPRPALAQQVPAAVELDLDGAQPPAVGLQRVFALAVGLLAPAELVLLGHQALDPGRDALVAHEGDATHPDGYAADLGLDAERFEQDRSGDPVLRRILRDVEGAIATGEVHGTPTLFIDGTVHRGS
jgi:2-hydroxychromene-2-carboxylate isomerase